MKWLIVGIMAGLFGFLASLMTASIVSHAQEEPILRCRDYPMQVEQIQTSDLICGVLTCGPRFRGISCVLIPLEEIP